MDKKTLIENTKVNIKFFMDNLGLSKIEEYGTVQIEDLIPKGCSLTSIQKLVKEAVEECPKFIALIAEGTMGDGKTEASFYAAWMAMKEWNKEGVSFMLPTCATSEGMLPRVNDMLSVTVLKDRKVSLATGNAMLSKFNDNSDESEELCRLFNSRMYDSFSVGTIDQALTAVAQIRFVYCRLTVLSTKVLVIDEVHSCDQYMLLELQTLLRHCVAYEMPVVILSATLTDEIKIQLLESLGVKNVNKADLKQGYPLVTIVDENKKLIQKESPITSSKKIKIEKLRYLNNIDKIVKFAKHLTKKGGNLCIMARTNDRAEKIFRAIEKAGIADEIYLYRAKTSTDIKEEKGKIICEKYGKKGKQNGNRPFRSIVVATPIVCQSLDIDFDFIISDLVPIDILGQLSGRLGRHSDEGTIRENPWYEKVLYILVPEGELTKWSTAPYNVGLMLSTLNKLNSIDEIDLIKGIRELINEVYDNAGEEYAEEKRKLEEKVFSKEILIDNPRQDEFKHKYDYEKCKYSHTRNESYETVTVTLLDDNSYPNKNISFEKVKYLLNHKSVTISQNEFEKIGIEKEEYMEDSEVSWLNGNVLLTKDIQEKYGIKLDFKYDFYVE